MGNRQSTINCMSKVVRAFLVCNRVTIRTLADKADISVDTARRAVAGLQKEGLVIQDTSVPTSTREYVYLWVGVRV